MNYKNQNPKVSMAKILVIYCIRKEYNKNRIDSY